MSIKSLAGTVLMGAAVFLMLFSNSRTGNSERRTTTEYLKAEETSGASGAGSNDVPPRSDGTGGPNTDNNTPPGTNPEGTGEGNGSTTGTNGQSNNGVADFDWSGTNMDGSLGMTADQLQSQIGGRGSSGDCAAFVGAALVAGNTGTSYPGVNASSMGGSLTSQGYSRINTNNPYEAPPGAVIVYGGGKYGHVEMRTSDGGFVSDYYSSHARSDAGTRYVTGIYMK